MAREYIQTCIWYIYIKWYWFSKTRLFVFFSVSEDWTCELDSALDFLAGERGQHPDDFVPYLQFLPESQVSNGLHMYYH